MKILAIRLKNLASLAGPFEIDFTAEPLASAGLFAITGPTGAGKSTLLDALCLALFGAVPRLGDTGQAKMPDADSDISIGDPRTLLRRGTGGGYAEVDFVGVSGRRYRARWEANRARDKASGKLQNSRQSLIDLDSDQLLASQKTEYKTQLELALGLNFEQFTRAVLLAQSEFSAFLKANDNERSELLEKLTSNLPEVRAPGGQLVVFADEKAGMTNGEGTHVINMPHINDTLSPILYTIPLQLLSYYVAVLKGTDVDQPRNLAKSVTVE